jgi:hypothetical protein
MKLMRVLTGPIVLIGVLFLVSRASRGSNSILPYAPPPVSPYGVTLSSSSGCSSTVSETDLFGAQPNDTIQISVSTCGIDCAGDVITIQALDGGTVIGSNQSVVDGQTGSASFTFQAGGDPGALQLTFLDNDCYFMTAQIWVFDLTDPGNNPPTVSCDCLPPYCSRDRSSLLASLF